EYRGRRPSDDPRWESRRVDEPSLRNHGPIPKQERAGFLGPLIRSSIADAAGRGESLTIVRPRSLRFRWRPKSVEEVEAERTKAAAASAQGSFLDAQLTELEPTPYHLGMGFEDATGRHSMMCGDWETPTAFWRWRRDYGEERSLQLLKKTYEEDYFQRGMVLALGTVAK